MGNLPMSSVLGISAITLGALVALVGSRLYTTRIETRPDSEAGPGEIFSWIIAVVSILGGSLVHAANLDMDPCMRSFAFGFVGANFGIGWMFWARVEDEWADYVPLVIGLVAAGLILGLLTSEGDVQKETKEGWEREADAAKANAKKAT